MDKFQNKLKNQFVNIEKLEIFKYGYLLGKKYISKRIHTIYLYKNVINYKK